MYPRPSGIVTLTTDHGLRDPYVGFLKGALITSSDKVHVVDLSHDVPAQDVAAGSFMLWTAAGRFPPGTVHIATIDAAARTERLLAATAHGQYWLAPNNGLLGAVLASSDTFEVRSIDLEHLRLQRGTDSSDGRDILAPVAAWLAGGRYGFSAMGPQINDQNQTDFVFAGERRVVHIDGYGNLITNLRGSDLPDCPGQQLVCGEQSMSLHRTVGEISPGEAGAYVGSFGLVEIALAHGNASNHLGIQRGAPIALSNA
jgi:hypothetical protein